MLQDPKRDVLTSLNAAYHNGEFLRGESYWDYTFGYSLDMNEWDHDERKRLWGTDPNWEMRNRYIPLEIQNWKLFALGRANDLTEERDFIPAIQVIIHFQKWLRDTHCEWSCPEVSRSIHTMLHEAHDEADELLALIFAHHRRSTATVRLVEYSFSDG